MATINISNEAQFRQLIKDYIPEKKGQVERAAAKTLTRIAGRARKDEQTAMPRFINRPVPFTKKSVLFEPAKASDGLNNMYSSVFIRKEASAYLQNVVSGGRIAELHGRSPILVPNITSLKRSVVKRKLGGRLINISGNVIGLNDGRIRQILLHPDVFITEQGQAHLVPGIYMRNVTTGRRRRNQQGLFTLFTLEQSQERIATFPFAAIGKESYRKNIVTVWRQEIGQEAR